MCLRENYEKKYEEKKFWNGPNGILEDLGETDSWKKPEVKNVVALSL